MHWVSMDLGIESGHNPNRPPTRREDHVMGITHQSQDKIN